MFKKLIITWVLLLAAGCSGPAKSLRVISDNAHNRDVSYTAEDLYSRAKNDAFLGKDSSAYQVKKSILPDVQRKLKRMDRDFNVTINENFLIIKW